MSEHTGSTATPETGRREFFSKAAIAAAAAAVAGVSISSKAQAANGDTVIVGTSHTGTTTTQFSGSTVAVYDGNLSVGGYDISVYGNAGSSTSQAAGVMGVSGGWPGRGVWGLSTGSAGVGIYGQHYGVSDFTTYPGTGVTGISDAGAGVVGSGTTFDLQATGSGKVGLGSAGTITSTTAASVGTLARDSDGNMWVAVAGNDWRKVAGPQSAGTLHLLRTPTRVYDSRAGKLPNVGTKAPLSSGSRTINCTKNASGVPSDAKGVIVNVTVLWSSATGYVAVTPGGAGDTGTSTANSPGAGGKTASSVTVGCGDGAKIDVSSGSGATFDFLVDVNGYYV